MIVAALAISANATPVTFGFTTTTSSGTFGLSTGSTPTTGNSYGVSSISNVLFTTLTVANDPTTADNKPYTLSSSGCTNGVGGFTGTGSSAGAVLEESGGVITLYGAVTSISNSNIDTGCNALATFTGTFTGTYISSSAGQFSFAGLAANGLATDSALLSDLGLTAANYEPTSLSSGSGFSGTSGTLNSGTDTYHASSEQFTMNLNAVPEPVSFLLGGSGLAGVLMLARRKRSQDQSAS